MFNYATSNYDANLVNDGRSDTVSSVAGGGSLSLSGSGFVSLPDFTSTPEGLTLAFWIRTPAYLTAPDQVVVEFGRNDYYNGNLRFLLVSGPQIEGFHVLSRTTANRYIVYGGAWYFVTWQIMPYQNGIKSIYYIDGTQIEVSLISLSYVTPYRYTNFIGNSVNPAYPSFEGNIDEFRLYKGILTAPEIESLYRESSTHDDDDSSSFSSSDSSSSGFEIVSIIVPVAGFVFGLIFLAVWAFRRQAISKVGVSVPTQDHRMSAFPMANFVPSNPQTNPYNNNNIHRTSINNNNGTNLITYNGNNAINFSSLPTRTTFIDTTNNMNNTNNITPSNNPIPSIVNNTGAYPSPLVQTNPPIIHTQPQQYPINAAQFAPKVVFNAPSPASQPQATVEGIIARGTSEYDLV